MTEQLTEEQRIAYAGRIKVLQDEIEDREEAIKNLKAKLAADLPLGEATVGTNDKGYASVTVYQHKAFNAAYGRKNLTPEAVKRATKLMPTFTAATAKDREYDMDGNIIKGLTEEEYALCQKPSDELSVKVELISND